MISFWLRRPIRRVDPVMQKRMRHCTSKHEVRVMTDLGRGGKAKGINCEACGLQYWMDIHDYHPVNRLSLSCQLLICMNFLASVLNECTWLSSCKSSTSTFWFASMWIASLRVWFEAVPTACPRPPLAICHIIIMLTWWFDEHDDHPLKHWSSWLFAREDPKS